MSDDKEPPSYEQLVELTIIEILKRGTVERVESALTLKTELTHEQIEQLVEHAQMRLVSSAPPEIRASLPTVVSFHRWNDIYQKATNPADRISAQKQIDRLMGSIH